MVPMTPIYHITHVANLLSIINYGGICCDSLESAAKIASVSIAYQHIKERRRRRLIRVGPGGTLADYVPFYFAPRSPMLYTINRGNVEQYTDGQRPIVHLVVYIEVIVSEGTPFVFTDAHAEMEVSEQFTDLSKLSEIDWELMASRWWNDTIEYPNRKQRRQAEFLVHKFCPWKLVSEIGVMNKEVAELVAGMLGGSTVQPQITVHPEWYY